MNSSAPPTLAERLTRVHSGTLTVRLGLARTALHYSQTSEQRAKAMDEIDAIKAELARRGLEVPA